MRFLLLVASLLSGCAGPDLLNTLARNPDRGTAVHRDLTYGEDPRQAFDLYVPSRPGPYPILMFVHGGSWASGDKDAYAFAGKRFAAEGYLTAVPSYRLAPEHAYPGFMEDMAAALAVTLKAAPQHGGDPERLFLMGHSAGAYNVVQLALAPEFLEAEGLTPAVIDAVAGLSGPYDFLPLDPGAAQDAFGSAEDTAATQPVNRVQAGAPPMILVTGTADETVRPRNTDALAERLRAVGTEVEVVRYEGADHAEPVIAVAFPKRLPVVADTLGFFERHGAETGRTGTGRADAGR